MPKGGKALDPSEIALIRQWIASGAIDDSNGTVASSSREAGRACDAGDDQHRTWDPQAQFSPDENVAVRRFVRLKNLKPAPAPPKVEGIAYNPIDRFVTAKWNDRRICETASGKHPGSDSTGAR
jgi:hypothetical protein